MNFKKMLNSRRLTLVNLGKTAEDKERKITRHAIVDHRTHKTVSFCYTKDAVPTAQ